MDILKVLLVSLIVFLESCDNSLNDYKRNELNKIRIETYIDTIQNKFRNFETNGAIKDELNQFLKNDFKKAIQDGVLVDLPFKLGKVERCGNRYVLELEHSLTSKLYDRPSLSQLELDLYGLTDETTAKSLQEGKFYVTEVEFKDYITLQNKDKYCALTLMSPFMGYFDNQIQFGAIAVDIKKIAVIRN